MAVVQPRPTDLSQKIQVIGPGFSRTGTSSFTLALEILLKKPVMHSGSACVTREECQMGTLGQPLQVSESLTPLQHS
jgi:hypothetical protein